jgi:hypothetical protein
MGLFIEICSFPISFHIYYTNLPLKCNKKRAITARFLLAASSAAAEQLQKITKAQIGARVAPHGKAPVVACLPAIGSAAMLDAVQGSQVFRIVRFHGNSAADMLQSGDLVADAVVGQSAEIIPPGVALGAVLQSGQGFRVAAKTKLF